MRKPTQLEEQLVTVHPNAPGLDIEAMKILACVPSHRDGEQVRTLGTFTPDLQSLAA